MSSNTSHIISTKNLKIGYKTKKDITIVGSNINIKVSSPTLICLLGKNGIGKSTLLRTLTQVQNSLDGEIVIKGKNSADITNLDLSKMVSIVLTEHLPESNLSVFEIVALGRQPYTNWLGTLTDNDLHLINEAFELTNTKHLLHKKYYELSDGQLQKVLIARALAQNTDIIIFDEPTSHLDIHHTIDTFLLLQKLVKEKNKTIIISTHEVNLALKIADELWVMTPTNFLSGSTSQLIEHNKIDQLFESDLIEFDTSTNQFHLK